MDKIQELHKELGEKEYGNVWPEAHAAITEDMMGKFAEWVEDCYRPVSTGVWFSRGNSTIHTTAELIQLFKEQL